MKLKFSEEIWKEGGMFVSYAPELDVAACGETIEQAKRNLLEVIRINVDEMKKLGTFEEFLRNAGYNVPESDDLVLELDKELVGFEAREVLL